MILTLFYLESVFYAIFCIAYSVVYFNSNVSFFNDDAVMELWSHYANRILFVSCNRDCT